MWCGRCHIKSSYSSRWLRSSFIAVLMMLSLEAYGELEINTAAWTFAGDNRVNIDVVATNGHGGSRDTIEGHFLPGFGLGLVYWFPRASFLGIGIEYLSSKVDCGYSYTDFWDVHCCALFRIQAGQNSAFPHGRIVPYLGIGYVGFQNLSGDTYVLRQDGYHDQGVDAWSSQLELKAGLEWMILGWAAIFVEGRIMTDNLEVAKPELKGVAGIPTAQLTFGIALHILE
jgi:hypothetical protein